MSEALSRLLAALEPQIPPQRIDRVWLFPPREVRGRESGLAVLALFPEGEGKGASRRHLLTLRYEAERQRGGLRLSPELVEQGTAPAERIEQVVAGVLRRLGGDAEPAPRAVRIAGDPEAWRQLVQPPSPGPSPAVVRSAEPSVRGEARPAGGSPPLPPAGEGAGG